ncbi:MAG: ATP-binding protein [Clostridium sp.]|nr:ATP-binding protein [Clostridium sp.]
MVRLWFFLCILLFLLCVFLVIYLIHLKGEMKNIKRELGETKAMSYNRQLTVSLFDRDLTELSSQINDNLDYQKKLKLEAERSETRLKQSVSDIAHDLRTPLTVIKGNLQLLLENDTLTEKDRNYINTCMDKADMLKCMVDDFFEMSLLESDGQVMQMKEVNGTNIIMQFIADHEAVIREHNLEPDIRLPEKSVMLLADEQMLTRMLGNLLGNVLKYAEQEFVIAMELKEKDNKMLCDISFSNKLSEDASIDVTHLFDRTYRGSRARTGQGAGLGLYIVRLLAEKQGAIVFAEETGGRLSIHMLFKISL